MFLQTASPLKAMTVGPEAGPEKESGHEVEEAPALQNESEERAAFPEQKSS